MRGPATTGLPFRLPPSGADETRFALIERDDVWRRAAAALGSARAGHGAVLLLEGSSGLGKSPLIEAVKALALESGMQALSARGSKHERVVPHGVTVQLLEAGLREADYASADGFSTFDLAPARGNGGVSGFDDLRGLYRLCLSVARATPLVLLVDDADLADEPSLSALLYVMERIRDSPVAIVLSAGTAGSGPPLLGDIARHPLTTRCKLKPLTPSGTWRRLAKRWPAVVTDEFAAEIHYASAGNPHVIDALVAVFEQRGDGEPLSFEENAPEALADWAMARALDVDPRAKDLLTAIAVLGEGCELRHVGALANVEPEAAGIVLDRLSEVDLLAHESRISFVQPAVGTAIRRAQPAGERAASNLRAARVLAAEDAPPERVANHLLHATRARSSWTVEVLCDAAAVALGGGAPADAVRYLRRALEEPPPRPDERASVVLELGRAEAAAGDPQAGIRLRAAVREPDQAITEPLAALDAGRTLMALGDPGAAIEAFERGLMKAGEADPVVAAWLRASRTAALWITRSADGRPPPLPPAPESSATPGDRVLLALHAIERAGRGLPATEVRDLAERALARGALLEDETSASLIYYFAAMALAFAEDLQTADATLTAAVEDARARGSMLGFAIAWRLRARAILMRGRLSDAAGDARRARAAERQDSKLGRGAGRTIFAAILVEQGDFERASHYLDEAESSASPRDPHRLWLLSTRGRLALYQGNAAAALQHYLRCGEATERVGVTNPAVVDWRAYAGLAAAATGDRAEGKRLIETDLAHAQAFGAPGPVGRALRALASVSRPAAALETLEAAVEMLRPSQAALERAGALVDFGAALRRSGKRRDAVPVLREGLDLAQRCGADVLVSRAMHEANAAGARPRRTALRGRDALTQRERQVASLAAQGHSNRAIAEKLVVTVKTVEWHLGHVYTKLGVKSRRDLADKLG